MVKAVYLEQVKYMAFSPFIAPTTNGVQVLTFGPQASFWKNLLMTDMVINPERPGTLIDWDVGEVKKLLNEHPDLSLPLNEMSQLFFDYGTKSAMHGLQALLAGRARPEMPTWNEEAFGGITNLDDIQGMFGSKATGIEHLFRSQGNSPLPYFVPYGLGIPPISIKITDDSRLKEIFERILSLTPEPRPWLARSIALNERPGKYESPAFLVDPRDPEGSYQRFSGTVRRMQEIDDRLGTMPMPMIGSWYEFDDGKWGFAYDIVSFVADSVNPTDPDEMHLAIVHGLGKGAVELGREAILTTVNRKSGNITFLGNKDQEMIKKSGRSCEPVYDPREYRQKSVHYFDPDAGDIAMRALAPQLLKNNAGYDCHRTYVQPISKGKGGSFGCGPFSNHASLANLVSILTYLHDVFGPIQIEGAFLNKNTPFPYLHQLITVPKTVLEERPLTIEKRHISSDKVIGAGKFEGPIIFHKEDRTLPYGYKSNLSIIDKLDEEFADTGYILVTDENTWVMFQATPHCRCRITESSMNVSSHAVTETRYRIAEDPGVAHILAMNAKIEDFDPSGAGADFREGNVAVYRKARIDSNGREVAVEIILPE